MNIYSERIERLRELMCDAGIDFYIVPTADFHGSEYVDNYFKVREFLSGFTGSAGTLAVSADEAGLWTDGRYFVQAEAQLEGSGIVLYRMREENVPTIEEYLDRNVKNGMTVGFDGRVTDASFGKKLEEIFEGRDVTIKYDTDVANEMWKDRPQLPCSRIWIVPDELSGRSVAEKLGDVREKMKEAKADSLLISKLDDIMWLYNIRANDVECNPVALSYTFITHDRACLFVQEGALSDELREYFASNDIDVMPYESVTGYISNEELGDRVWCPKKDISYLLYKLAENKAGVIIERMGPVELLKAVKNPVELENIRKFYLMDSVVLTRFLFWMKENAGKLPMDEISVAKKLDSMRAELDGFLELSFPTISAYKANAAMAHYSADENSKSSITAEGLYLVDSGAQYKGATTDVTRTIAMGALPDEIKMHFTKVACAMLRMADVRFIKGCTGRNLDIIAREPLWECGLDYKHGTGHGIGYILNVHEGPQSLRWQYREDVEEAVLEEGMIISDEPGIYIEGSHGIRTENILEVISLDRNEYGQFMGMRHLTCVPIDLDAIDVRYMTNEDIDRLNRYHGMVYEKLSPYFSEAEKEALRHATRALDSGHKDQE